VYFLGIKNSIRGYNACAHKETKSFFYSYIQLYNLIFWAITSVGSVVGGHIFDTTGNYNLAFMLCLIFYAVAVVSMFLARRPKIDKSSPAEEP
jgi:predicted branched-subunit amino acid permease